MSLRTVSEIVTRADTGRTHIQHVYKPSVPAAGQVGGWIDTSMSAGTPIYNAYVGGQLESTALYGSGNRGIFTGGQGDRRLINALFQTRSTCVPALVLMLDYLMFYPLIDLDSTEVQETTASATLPRTASGTGVMIMPVITLPSTAQANCTVVYTNSDGVAGRTTTFRLLQGTATGHIAATSNTSGVVGSESPFVPLARGDKGVRSIQSVTLAAGVGGFACFALVRPVATVVVPEVNTCSELSFVGNKFNVPFVAGDAYLNFIIKTQAATASLWLAQLTFVDA